MCSSKCKALLFAALCLCVLTPRAEAAVTLVQFICDQSNTGDQTINFAGNTTTGNAIVVAISFTTGTQGGFTASDATNGTYTGTIANDTWASIEHFRNITGGFTGVSIDAPGANTGYVVCLYEINGADNSATIQTCTGGGSAINHDTCSSGISGNGFAVATNSFDTGYTLTPGAGWTLDTTSPQGVLIERNIDTFTNNAGPFSSSVTSFAIGAMAIFPEVGSVGSGAGLLTNLIEYWKLNEASGSRAGVHAGLTLTDNNTVTSGSGKVYTPAADFENGNTEFLSRADEAALSTGNIDFTFAIWVNLESNNNGRPIAGKCQDLATDQCEWHLEYNQGGNRFRFYVASGANFANQTALNASTFGAPSLATWYLVIVWHDATADTINIAVNGGAADSTAYTFGSYDSTANFYIGDDGFASNTYDGLLGPAMFWKNRVLSADDRTLLWNSGNGLVYESFTAGGGGSSHRRRALLGVGD